MDKTGPEGHIDALLMHGQGKHSIKSVYGVKLDFVFASETLLASLLDAVVVVGNGRLLRSWETTVGGLKWETVLDSGRLCLFIFFCFERECISNLTDASN